MSATSAAFVAPVARISSRSTRRHRVHAPIARAVAPSSSSSSSVRGDALPTFPGGWLGPDLAADPGSWTHRLTDDEIAELDAALASARRRGSTSSTSPRKPSAPTLKPRLDARGASSSTAADSPVQGRPGPQVHAVAEVRGVLRDGRAHGLTCPQNARGHVLGHVKDLGADPNDPRLESTPRAPRNPSTPTAPTSWG